MRLNTRIVATVLLLLTSAVATWAQTPSVTSISPNSGGVGSSIVITGSGFGATQGSSTVSLNGTSAAVASWSDSNIVVTVPSGATSGSFSVTVSGQAANSSLFTITSLPSSWSDGDIGTVGVAGSATYSNGTFTVKGAGTIGYTADGLHFGYQSLSGDGTIIARVLTMQGGSSPTAGVMIRESLNANSTEVSAYATGSTGYFYQQYRSTTGASSSSSYSVNSQPLPTYVKLVRAGNSFTGSYSFDAVSWVQITNISVTMAQNVYVGLAVSSASTSSATTATFDSVSISSSVMTSPSIAALTTTTGSVGATIGIGGSNFGSLQGNGVVMLNGLPMTIVTWSASSIVFTIPTGATSGYLFVATGSSMNASTAIYFHVTGQPLPSEWLDQDIGQVPSIGSASFLNGAFAVSGGGNSPDLGYRSDGLHFVYQPLSGDGTIIARVVSMQGGSAYYAAAGIMIRETLSPSSTDVTASFLPPPSSFQSYRSTAGATEASTSGSNVNLPCWLKLVRSGNIFSTYWSQDGIDWLQAGSNVTISMAQNVYVGLAVSSGSATTGMTNVTFDSVSVNTNPDPQPVISNLSATTGPVGTQVTINGSNFGASQGTSIVSLKGSRLNVNFWSATTIVVTIPAGASSGLLVVSLGPDMNDSNAVYFTVTSQPLPLGWIDSDVGQIGPAGSATFSNGTFTIAGSGYVSPTGTVDGFHFVYQTMTGDGSIVARVVSQTGAATYASAGVMIRETLAQGSTNAYTSAKPGSIAWFIDRTTTSGTASASSNVNAVLPYWMKVVRTGNIFSGYTSADGTTWAQVGSNVTITMAQTVNVGLAVGSGSNTNGTNTATFSNVSVTVGTTPYLSGLSPSLGPVGTSVTIAGSNFGATQGTSTLTFNGVLATPTSWSNSQIVATVPAATPDGSGTVTVTVNSIASVPALQFTAIKPVITSLAPPAAPILGTVILNGSGFGMNQVDSQVFFNGVSATIYSWSATSVSVGVPPNATTGPVTMVRGGVTSNSAQFTLIEALSVSGISPTSGPVGTTVTISGAGFGPTQSDSVASFYGAAANVVSWSDTQIVATVPVGTSTGNVTVAVAGTTAQGPVFFLNSSLTLTDSLSHTTTYNAQVVGGVWRVTDSQGSGCSTCTQRGTIHTTYDSNGSVLTRTDESGHVKTYTNDSNGNVLSVSEPDGNGNTITTSYTYNSFNEVLTTTDPLGNVTTNLYDPNGNLLQVTTPKPDSNTAASVTKFAYNSLGQLIQITDPLGHITILGYKPTGLLQTIQDAQNHVTTYDYDTHGNRKSVLDALNNLTKFDYDTGDRLKTITYPDLTTTIFGYDTRGRRTSVTDQNGKITTYGYDDADRLTTVKDAANNTTTYGYDTENNLKTVQDANNNTTSFDYDEFGRLKKTTFPSGYIESYNYDAVGNLKNKTDRNNQLVIYDYDGLNRLKKKTYPDTTTVNYTYDFDSHLTQVIDPTGTYKFSFDNMGRLIGASVNYTFLSARTFTTSYGYDFASNRTGFTDPEGGATAYIYDTLNRLQTLTPPAAFSGTGSFVFGYDFINRRTQMTRPNNITTNYGYDTLSHLTSVLHQSGSTTLDGARYVPDNAGNRKSKTDLSAGVTSNYGYDDIYELKQVMQGANTTESYTYDPVGNRLTSLAGNYGINSSNQLTSSPTATFQYDYNGNTQSKTDTTGITTYAWDFENRLTSVILPSSGGTVSFKYDPFGRRIQKSFTTGANPPTTTTTNYLYDGDNTIEEVDPNGSVLARYSDGLNIDEPLTMLRGGATSYYHADGLGTVTSLSNAAGALAQTYTFDSFGRQTASSGSLTNTFRYTGREFDTESSLYYMRARYFDPATGRFLSEDRLQFSASGSDFYKYVFNNPTNFRDPSGLDPSVWQKLLNWLWPSPAPSTKGPNCPPPAPAYIPPWIPVKQFNRFKTGPSSGPYRPNSGPQAPEGPINPTEPPPVIDPPLPGGLPETIPPTPFTPSPSPPEMIPGFPTIGAIIGAIIDALSSISDPIISTQPRCGKGCT